MGNSLLLTPDRPLPSHMGIACFTRPTGRPALGQTVDHFRFSRAFGEEAKVTAQAVAYKMNVHLSATGGRPIVIEAAPALLGDDITGTIELAGLREQLLARCRSVFFCSDIFTPEGDRTDSFQTILFRQPISLEIYINTRMPDGSFRLGLDHFGPLMKPLALIQALAQDPGSRSLDFLFPLNAAAATNTLLSNLPASGTARENFTGLLSEFFLAAQRSYHALGRAGKLPEELTDSVLATYSRLASQVGANLPPGTPPPAPAN